MSYAAETEVPVEKTKAQIESLLMRYGADRFASMADRQAAVVAFSMGKKTIRFKLPLPTMEECRVSPEGKVRHLESEREKLRRFKEHGND